MTLQNIYIIFIYLLYFLYHICRLKSLNVSPKTFLKIHLKRFKKCLILCHYLSELSWEPARFSKIYIKKNDIFFQQKTTTTLFCYKCTIVHAIFKKTFKNKTKLFLALPDIYHSFCAALWSVIRGKTAGNDELFRLDSSIMDRHICLIVIMCWFCCDFYF